ncbi:hypothetical protein MUN78_10080 [Leucobacter allii]|uniref:Uncharacterized protein n=1 Tax=Leucobacter allii TaxID=2932247 RepID=A0ABY4FKI1_9MICO|nr:hypothetical protein [Leucobacter allii]UOQ56051.1 hypothetical protein MUN78_10080 [Leucobacter allii]
MSTTIERPVEAAHDLKPSYVPDNTVTDEKRAWCAATLADLPTVITFREEPVQVGRDPRGTQFRMAFTIGVTPGNRFRINLLAGASPSDLKHAEELIELAKSGRFNPDIWEPSTFKGGRSGWLLDSFWAWDGKHDVNELRPCTVYGCAKDFHTYRNGEFNDVHESAERVDAEFYDIDVSNFEDESRWRPYICFADEIPEGPAGLKVLRDAANDFDWLQQHADHLNSRLGESGGVK